MNRQIIHVSGKGIPLRGNDIDTDVIVPARFLMTTSFDGLAKAAFHDRRFDENGNKKDHPFNDERYMGANILVVNKDFGSGSSREHAPQALKAFGIQAIIGESFAGIFDGNCTAIGIPAVTLGHDKIESLQAAIEISPQVPLTLNIEDKTITMSCMSFEISVRDPVRKCLLEGTWDPTSQLVAALPRTRELAQNLPYLSGFSRH